jgi:hypothetical protein
MRADATLLVAGQIRGVSFVLHGAERRRPLPPPSIFQTVSRRDVLQSARPLRRLCIFSPLLLVGEATDPVHVRLPGEIRAGVPVVVARHLIVPSDMANSVTSHRPGVIVLDTDAVFRA